MIYEMEVKAKALFEHTTGMNTSTLKEVKVVLVIPENFDKSFYYEDGLPNANGCKALTGVLVSALVSNIEYANKMGYRDEVEHIKYVIDRLSQGFAEQKEVLKDVY